MACSINLGSVIVCGEIVPAGILPFVELYDFAAYKAATKTFDPTDGFITSITNALDLKSFRFEAADDSGIVPLVEPRKVVGGFNVWKHGLTFMAANKSQAMQNNIEIMQNTKVVAIIMRNDGKGQVIGGQSGMQLSALPGGGNSQDPNLGNVFSITVETTDEQGGEPKLPLIIDAGDYTSTLALIESTEVAGIV